MNYSIGDFLIRIKNAYMAHKVELEVPYSKVILAIGKIMVEEGYIKSIEEREENGKKSFHVKLQYNNRVPALSEIKLISTPSQHIYVKKNAIPRTYGGQGLTVVTTSKGIMSDKNAKKQKLGGKILCTIF